MTESQRKSRSLFWRYLFDERGPTVVAADEVKEARNRRVEINER